MWKLIFCFQLLFRFLDIIASRVFFKKNWHDQLSNAILPCSHEQIHPGNSNTVYKYQPKVSLVSYVLFPVRVMYVSVTHMLIPLGNQRQNAEQPRFLSKFINIQMYIHFFFHLNCWFMFQLGSKFLFQLVTLKDGCYSKSDTYPCRDKTSSTE